MPKTTADLDTRVAEDMIGTLHLIVHAGHADNTSFIRERQAELRRKYRHLMPCQDPRLKCSIDISPADTSYSRFMFLLKIYSMPAQIRDECEDILNDLLGSYSDILSIT
jgi:hypothetical protein